MTQNLLKTVTLSEGVAHLEDLSVSNFISAVENLSDFIATEKLDGANLRFGLDNDGEFYTSRAAKGDDEIIHSADEYRDTPAGVMFKAAHLALEQKVDKIKGILSAGDAVEVEIMFGKQPNAITYGADDKSYIAILRAVTGTSDKIPNQSLIKKLVNALQGEEVTIQSTIFDSPDGIELKKTNSAITWRFVRTQEIDSSDLKKLDVSADIKELKAFLSKNNSTLSKIGISLTNEEVLSANLSKFDKEKRDAVKTERENVTAEVYSFKLKIKEKMLDSFVRKIKPKLQKKNVSNDEDVGIEGIVLLDPKTQDQVKIVDKDVFTAINQFNFAIRRNLNGVVKSTDPLEALENKGGIFGEAKIRIASLFDLPNLARGGEAKKIFKKFKGRTVVDTANAFAESVKKLDFNSIKTKILAIFENTLKELDEKLETFKKDSGSYKLELKTGKTIGYSEEVVKRTLLAFAELRKSLLEFQSDIKKAKRMEQLILALYGKQIEEIHSDVKESVEQHLVESVGDYRDTLKLMNAQQICDAYTATLLSSLLLLKIKEPKAAKIIRDPAHTSLKTFHPNMSILNFWGMVLFYPENKAIKPYLTDEVFKELRVIGGRFIEMRINSIHKTICGSNNTNLNWETQYQNMRVVTLRLENRSAAINTIRNGIIGWDSLELGGKNDVLDKLYMLMMRTISNSPLTTLVRNLTTRTLMNASNDNQPGIFKSVATMVGTTFKKLKEDDGGAAVGDVVGGTEAPQATGDNALAFKDGATSSNDIAQFPFRLFKGKVIRRVKRTFEKKKNFGRDKDAK